MRNNEIEALKRRIRKHLAKAEVADIYIHFAELEAAMFAPNPPKDKPEERR